MKKFLLSVIVLTIFLSGSINAQTINAPSNLTAEPENMSYIKLRWDDNSNNENGFYIERSTVYDTTIAWEILAGTGQNGRQYFDYWITNNVTYYYRVYAYAGNLRSAYSNVAYTTAVIDTVNIPKAPSNLHITNTTPNSITIGWNDNSINESGFIIARRRQDETLFRYIDTVTADILTYQEVGLTPDNIYFYKVCAYNSFGLSDFTNTVFGRTVKNTSIITPELTVPEKHFLGNNYPNPFNPATTIRFGITDRAFVSLKVYNTLGRETETLINNSLSEGIYNIKWNAAELSSGLYYYRLTVNPSGQGLESYSEVKKMILLK